MANTAGRRPEQATRYAPKLSLIPTPPGVSEFPPSVTATLRQNPSSSVKLAVAAAPPTQATARASDPALPTVAFISPKGGAGKTTAALLLALGLADQGRRVALIDADPNRPLLHWAAMPSRPELISVHAARTIPDLCDAIREARRAKPDCIIVDTEGSVRGAMVFAAVRLDLVITPLAGSQLDAREAIKTAELVAAFGKGDRHMLRHRCLLTRVPAALQTRGLRAVVEELRDNKVEILPVALVDKEAFRLLFASGGSLRSLAENGVWGVPAAQQNTRAYVESVLDLLNEQTVQASSAAE